MPCGLRSLDFASTSEVKTNTDLLTVTNQVVLGAPEHWEYLQRTILCFILTMSKTQHSYVWPLKMTFLYLPCQLFSQAKLIYFRHSHPG